MTTQNILKDYRAKHNLTQKSLADKFASWGLTQRSVQHYEAGRRKIPTWLLKLIEK